MSTAGRIFRSTLIAAVFALLAFGLLKLVFVFLCFYVVDHEPVETSAGIIVPTVFAVAFGMEGLWWWRDRRRA